MKNIEWGPIPVLMLLGCCIILYVSTCQAQHRQTEGAALEKYGPEKDTALSRWVGEGRALYSRSSGIQRAEYASGPLFSVPYPTPIKVCVGTELQLQGTGPQKEIFQEFADRYGTNLSSLTPEQMEIFALPINMMFGPIFYTLEHPKCEKYFPIVLRTNLQSAYYSEKKGWQVVTGDTVP